MVWYEGMTLDPQHFQQWDRYRDSLLNSRINSIDPNRWGFANLQINPERLANGEFVVELCEGILADGLVFSCPQHNELPKPLNIVDEFPTGKLHLDVFLSVPALRVNGANYKMDDSAGNSQARWSTQSISAVDENTGANELQIRVGAPRLSLTVDGVGDASSLIQIARVEKNVNGRFVLDSQFIPSCLRIGASTRLSAIARGLLESMVSRSASLSDRKITGPVTSRQLTSTDVEVLGQLAALNSHIPLVRHHLNSSHCHPEQLYYLMLSLVGQLSAWVGGADVHPRELPLYDHSALSGCANELDDRVRAMLGGPAPTVGYKEVVLARKRPNFFEASLDASMATSGQFVLAIRDNTISEASLTGQIPNKMKIAAPSQIDGVVQSSITALGFNHTTRLPVGMPEDTRASYFKLETQGGYWDAIKADGALSIYLPAELSTAEIRLFVTS